MSDVRVAHDLAEPLAEGAPEVRVPLAVGEPLAQGAPTVRVALDVAEPLSEGAPQVRAPLIILEALQPVPEEGEMATEIFPIGLGLSWSTRKRPNFNTQVHTSTSLRTTRNSLTPFPAWDFEVSFVWLLDIDGQPNVELGTTDLKHVMGFFLGMRGRHGAFLHRDPNDFEVTAGNMLRYSDQGVGGDGVTTEFWFARELTPFIEPVGQVEVAHGYTIYLDGVAVDPGDFTFVAPNRITFDVAPADGVEVTATFRFFFVCHFLDDAADFETFAGNLWQLQQVEFRADPA